MLLQQLLVGMARVLATSIRVVNQAWWWGPEIGRHHQGPDHQRFLHPSIHRSAHHTARIQINYHRQVDPALLRPEIRDVRSPGLVGTAGGNCRSDHIFRYG